MTIRTYKSGLKAFFDYLVRIRSVNTLSFRFDDCTLQLLLEYSEYLQEQKHYAPESVNNRLTAIRSYLEYISNIDVNCFATYMAATKVPLVKGTLVQKAYIAKDALAVLLDGPNNSRFGIRDRTLLVMLYDTAVRVRELTNLSLGNVHMDIDKPYIHVHGKGNKDRNIFLHEKTLPHVRQYIRVFHDVNASPDTPFFYVVTCGQKHEMSTRNVERILNKYVDIARKKGAALPESVYPHMLRRTRATGLYQDDVPLELISAMLGHANLEVTQQYAIPSTEQLRQETLKGTEKEPDPLWLGHEDDIARHFGLI